MLALEGCRSCEAEVSACVDIDADNGRRQEEEVVAALPSEEIVSEETERRSPRE